MKFSICIDSVFQGVNNIKALEQVREAGFDAFEFWGWQNRDMEAQTAKAKSLGLTCVCFCTSFFLLTDPAQRGKFIDCLKDSIVAAKKAGVNFLLTQSGNDTGAVRPFQHRSIVEGLRAAAPLLEESGITLLLEPLNGKINHRGIFLESSDEGFEILDEAGSRNIRLLFDIYHQQITEGDIIRRMTANIGKIGHVHCAGNPGRHELENGELDYRKIFGALEESGYKNHIGIEYFPSEPVMEGLRRVREMAS